MAVAVAAAGSQPGTVNLTETVVNIEIMAPPPPAPGPAGLGESCRPEGREERRGQSHLCSSKHIEHLIGIPAGNSLLLVIQNHVRKEV